MIAMILGLTLAGTPLGRHGEHGWGIDDGLPQSSVTAIAQDRAGWLQLGTFGGLARFDGRSFEVHGASEDMGWSTVRITALTVTADGTRWIGLQSGDVVRIDPDGVEVQIVGEPNLQGRPIWALRELDDGMWAAGSGGVARFDGEWTAIEGAAPTRAIALRQGVVWLGGTDGLQIVDGITAAPSKHVVGELFELVEHDDALVMAGDLGITMLDDGGLRPLDREPSQDLAIASDGTIYGASDNRVRIVGEPGALELGSRIRDIFIDREQVVWVGTDADGLRRLVREDWSIVDVGAGVLPVLEADDGALLVGYGCEPGGVVRVLGDGTVAGVTGGCVRALARRGDQVLMGMDGVLVGLGSDGSTERLVDIGHVILVVRVLGDDVLVGTETGGAYRLRGDLEAAVPERLPVVDRRVLAIEAGSAGELWFGGQDGLTRLDGGGATRWTRADGVPTGEIRALRIDADGTVFIGSYGGGLGVLRDGVLRRLTRRDGLADDVISAILDDGRGALWLHGNRGLTRLMRGDLEAALGDPTRRVTVRRWSTPEGNGGGQPAGIVMRDGSLALPTIAGIVRMDPRDLHDVVTTPSLTLLRADIDGVGLVPNLEAEVPAGIGRVELEFTAAILRHPELAVFEYRVGNEPGDGAEPPWQRVGDDRRLHWAGFRPGHYRIELRVANESGVFSPVTTLRFALEAPWLERWSVRAGIVVALTLLVGGALQWRARVMRANLVGLQREIDQRLAAEAEARALAKRLEEAERLEAVGRLAGGIAHDFNNLFAAIRGATSTLPAQSGHKDGDAEQDPIVTIDACIDRGARLTGQLLSFARKQHLAADSFDLCELLPELEPMLREVLPPGASLILRPAPTPLHVLADASAMQLAIRGLVANAGDAIASRGTVCVRVFALDDSSARARWPELRARTAVGWVVLEVEDDGTGIPADRLAKVLEPFYSTRSEGAGLGLPSALGFAMQSGGTLRLTSTPGVGTRASLVLPRAAAASAIEPLAPPVLTSGSTPSEGHHIVVVDDDDLVGSAVAMILRRGGHRASVFRDPIEALGALRRGAPCDLLITDLLMPGLTGSELADAVLADRPGTPVVFISGFTRDIDANSLPGVLLAKPFRSSEVLAAVEFAIARAASAVPG